MKFIKRYAVFKRKAHSLSSFKLSHNGAAAERASYIVNKGAYIRSLRAKHVDCVFAVFISEEFKTSDFNLARLSFNFYALSCKVIKSYAVNALCAEHGRELHYFPFKTFKRRLNIFRLCGNLAFGYHFARDVKRVGSFPEYKRGFIALVAVGKEVKKARGTSEHNGKNARRHRVKSSRMAGFFYPHYAFNL